MTAAKETWLPNLVGGVSIWKLAGDLNQARFFDGRLLVPETEGSDSLPVKVLWTVDGLVPLTEARASHPEAAAQATADLVACVERVKKELSLESSGYRRFKDALTMPALDGAGAENYFFDPKAKKLFAINWGASPRSLAGQGELVFGYDRFDELVRRAKPAATVAPAAAGAAIAPAPQEAAAAPSDEKKEEKKDEKKSRLWLWLLLGLALVVLIVLLGLLLKDCGKEPRDALDAGTDAGGDAGGASDGGDRGAGKDGGDGTDGGAANGSHRGDAGGGRDAASDAGPDAGGDAGADGGAEGGDAGADGGKDAGADAGKDGGADGGKDASGSGEPSGPPKNGKVYQVGAGGAKAGSGSGSASGSASLHGGAGGPHAHPDKPIPFRSHFQPDAVAWRITTGAEVVSDEFPPEIEDGAFEVYLKPGHTFSEITVEYQDKAGQWHKH